MAKKITKKIKLQVDAGKASPTPPLGPALGQAGINIGDFVSKFNAATLKDIGNKVSVVIAVYDDRSYDFIIKTPPTTGLILKAAGLAKGSSKNSVVGKISQAQAKEIAEKKMSDLSAKDLKGAVAIITGSARSMGIKVE
jgi:large subunit ribosomal protein L11